MCIRDRIRPDQQDVCLFVEDFDMIAVRSFVNQAMERCSGLCAAFEGTEEAGYHYIIGSSRLDTRTAAKALDVYKRQDPGCSAA